LSCQWPTWSPVGWVAAEPQIAHPKLRALGVPWTGPSKDKDDNGLWAVTCFCVRKGYRAGGITFPLGRADADYAREQGATAVERYAMVTEPRVEIIWDEVHVGAAQLSPRPGSPRSAPPPNASG
jgi:hypothetical protein